MSRNNLRMEALPLGWDTLSDSQRAAVSCVSAWLLEALDAIPPSDCGRRHSDRPHGHPQRRAGCLFAPQLDHNRRSQIAFIDGDRGTGKSSVLLTLMDLTSGNPREPKSLNLSDSNQHSAKRLQEQGARLIWLETLDMEPLSQGTNLFAAILARIAQVLDGMMGERPPIAAALGDPDGYSDVVSLLQQLQNDAAIVWDRLGGASHGGDPQDRALWVMQAEKAGLDLNRRIAEVLDGIACTLRPTIDHEPLFVLPVDDFDLAPAHCLELLRLIRMVTTPRLFFLVAGNTRIAESVLKLRSEGDLMQLAGAKPSNADEVRDCAVEIAANNMRKLVPPGQRARLAVLRIWEALSLGANVNGGPLSVRLEAVRFKSNQAPTAAATMSFLRFLLLDKPQGGGGSMGAEWLAGTPRQVLDCRELFARLERSTPDTEVTEVTYQRDATLLTTVLEELQRQVSEEWRFPYTLREKLVKMLDTSVRISLDFESHIRVEQVRAGGVVLKTFEHGLLLNFAPVVASVFAPLSRESVSYQGSQSDREPRIELPSRLAAGMMLAHDLAVSLYGGYLRHSALTYAADVGPKVECRWGSGSYRVPTVIWPTPEWWTFRDFERFSRHWSLHSGQCGKSFGSAWLTAILEVVLDEACIPGSSGLTPLRLADFSERLAREEPTRGARRRIRSSTLVVIGLLLAPEYASGLELADFQDAQAVVTKAILDQEIKQRIRDARAHSYREALERDAPISTAAVALSAVIAPKSAWRRFKKSGASTFSRDMTASTSEDLGIKPFFERTLEKPSIADIDRLKSLRSTIIRDKSSDYSVNLLDALIFLAANWDSSNPYNMLEDGAFVPTEEDIERAR